MNVRSTGLDMLMCLMSDYDFERRARCGECVEIAALNVICHSLLSCVMPFEHMMYLALYNHVSASADDISTSSTIMPHLRITRIQAIVAEVNCPYSG